MGLFPFLLATCGVRDLRFGTSGKKCINISQKEGTKTRKQRKTKSKHEKRKQARLMSARWLVQLSHRQQCDWWTQPRPTQARQQRSCVVEDQTTCSIKCDKMSEIIGHNSDQRQNSTTLKWFLTISLNNMYSLSRFVHWDISGGFYHFYVHQSINISRKEKWVSLARG